MGQARVANSMPDEPLVVRARRYGSKHLRPETAARVKRSLARLRPTDLRYLATIYGTDKGVVFHLERGPHGYTALYERYLRERRREPLCLLEIGILAGA